MSKVKRKSCGHTRHIKKCLICHMTRIGSTRSAAKTAATRKNLKKARAVRYAKPSTEVLLHQ